MIRALIKLRLSGLFSGIASKNKKGEFVKPSRAKVILFSILYAYIAIVFTAFAAVAIWGVGAVLIPAGLPMFFFGVVITLSFAVIFIFSIFETKAELFDCKDNELVLSMPIKPGSIVISRIIVVLIYNYLIGAIFTIPATVVYAIYSGGEIKGIIGSLLTSLITPLVATALASAVGYAVAAISKKLKNKTLATMAISIIFLALYFWGYSALLGNVEEADIAAAIIGMTENIGFVGEIGRAALLYPLNTAIFMLVGAAIALGAYLLVSAFYFSIITSNHSASRSSYKKKKLRKSSSVASLVRKEFSKIASSATYMLNCGIGVAFLAVVAVLVVIKKDLLMELVGILPMLVEGADTNASVALAASVIMLFISSMITFSACALSLEGDSLWIIRSMPLRSRDILISKAIPHIIIVAPISLIASCVMSLSLGLDALSSILLILVPLLGVILSAILGVVLNVAIPKFKFNNEVEVIKQSASVFLTMLSMMIVSFAGLGLAVLGVIYSLEVLMHALLLILLAVLSVASYFILTTACERRLESL